MSSIKATSKFHSAYVSHEYYGTYACMSGWISFFLYIFFDIIHSFHILIDIPYFCRPGKVNTPSRTCLLSQIQSYDNKPVFIDVILLSRKRQAIVFTQGTRIEFIVKWLNCLDRFGVEMEIYSGINRTIPWLLMPWLLASPGHQQPCYRLNRINDTFTSYSATYYIMIIKTIHNERPAIGSLYIKF